MYLITLSFEDIRYREISLELLGVPLFFLMFNILSGQLHPTIYMYVLPLLFIFVDLVVGAFVRRVCIGLGDIIVMVPIGLINLSGMVQLGRFIIGCVVSLAIMTLGSYILRFIQRNNEECLLPFIVPMTVGYILNLMY